VTENTNTSRHFVIIVTRSNLYTILATWLHWNLASWQTGFSLIVSAHRTLKSIMAHLSIFRTSYVLSRCVPNVKRWVTWALFAVW